MPKPRFSFTAPLHLAASLLKLGPGLAALLSVLAVWSAQLPRIDPARPAFNAGQSALPELRPTPLPAPGPLLLDAPPTLPRAQSRPQRQTGALLGSAQRPYPAPDLHALGRQQTDGG